MLKAETDRRGEEDEGGSGQGWGEQRRRRVAQIVMVASLGRRKRRGRAPCRVNTPPAENSEERQEFR